VNEAPKAAPRTSLTRKQLLDSDALDLLALLQTVTHDGRLLNQEIRAIDDWLADHATSTLPAVAYLRAAVRTVLADCRVTSDERAWLQTAIETVLPREERQVAIARRREAEADAGRHLTAQRELQQQFARLCRPVATFDFMVAGASYDGRPAIIEAHVREGDTVLLVRQHDNQYSPNATLIRLKNGLDIGYAPEADAQYLAPLLDRGAVQSAQVKKILTGGRGPIPVVWGELYQAEAPVPEAGDTAALAATRAP
jgi:predicted transcriptional regulator